MKIRQLLYTLCGSFICSVASAQIQNRVCDTIPYEFIHEKIIIPVTVNGKSYKYIVDTGGQTGTVYDIAVGMAAKSMGYSAGVSDLNQTASTFQKGLLENIRFGSKYKLNKLETLLFPQNGFFKELGVAGILGGDAFAQSVITFDSRSKIMVINYPYRPEKLKVEDGTLMNGGDKYHPIIPFKFGNTNIEVLFDTGASGFLLLSSEDYNSFGSKIPNDRINKAYGLVGAGIAGLGKPVEIDKLNMHEISLMGKKFVNVGCTTIKMGKTIIGVELLKYGKVIIDYMRNRFYFIPFDTAPTDMGGAPILWNVDILPIHNHFEITTVWQSMKDKVNFGDQVININGTDLKDFPASQMETEKLMNDIPGNTGYIIILKDGKEKKIEIKREK